MTIERSDSQQTTCNATAIVNGERRQVATATCSVRLGRNMNISIDLAGDVTLAPEDLSEIADMFAGYLADEIRKAAALGIPVGCLVPAPQE